MLRKQKGQSFVEFALILPLLLLLILGVIEAARVIWAFINVQQAAREATRYAVTGRPYVRGSLDSLYTETMRNDTCRGDGTESDPISENEAGPWLCPNEGGNARVGAVKKIAESHLRNLAYSDVCDQPEEYFGVCAQTPGAIGILVIGQLTTNTVNASGTLETQIITQTNHAGLPGLNVYIETFYNLQMITPIFDAVMGGTYIRLRGGTQLQNEGLDAAAGIEPPPPINPPSPGESAGGGGFSNTAQIWPVNGYDNIKQSDSLRVHLEDHSSGNTYNVYLSAGAITHSICEPQFSGGVQPDVNDRAEVDCDLALSNVAPGLYDLYSTVYPSSGPTQYASAPEQVEIIAGGDPKIVVEGGDIWAANETTNVILQFHPAAGAPYTVELYDGDGVLVPGASGILATGHSGSSLDKILWKVPDLEALGVVKCDLLSSKTCSLKSRDKDGNLVASPFLPHNFNINQPKIVLQPKPIPAPGFYPYFRGQVVYIKLSGHTPGRAYNITVNPTLITPPDTPPLPQTWDTVEANSQGDVTIPTTWPIPGGCGLGQGWPDGKYEVYSTPRSGLSSDKVAQVPEIEIFGPNPNSPVLSVDGGNVWLAGDLINIRVLGHQQNYKHYLEFDGNRVPTQAVDDTFITGSCGDALIDYTIPGSTPAGDYTIASYDKDDVLRAAISVTVIAIPRIEVLEGDKVLPDETITVRVTSHAPDTGYDIYYADRKIQSILTDNNGVRTFTYDLKTLPSTPVIVYGLPYEMSSRTVSITPTIVATTNLTLQAADLVVTQVEVAPFTSLDATVPITVYVQNAYPVTVTRPVDVDMYFLQHPEPDPIAPSYLTGYNFPGDIKFWKNLIGPYETFFFTHTIQASQLGVNTIYGYADTSNNVYESELSGQVANPNNINNAPMLVNCPTTLISDDFSNAALPGWGAQTYGDGGSGTMGTVVGSALQLNSTGSSTWQSNDNSGGQLYFYRTTPITSSQGLDVQIKITHVDLTSSWTKAGLEIRDSLNSTSPRVVFGVARNNGSSTVPRQVMQAGHRNTGQGMSWVNSDTYWINNHKVDVVNAGATPVWIRIERLAGDNGTFNFYYKQSATAPPAPSDDQAQQTYWGSPQGSVQVSGIGNQVYVGLFNSSYSSSTASTSNMDDFSMAVADFANCIPSTQGFEFPPGYQVCSEALDDRSFEASSSKWLYQSPPLAGAPYIIVPGASIPVSGGAHTGNRFLRSDTDIGAPVTPHFTQQFVMPDFIVSNTTTLDVSFYHKIFNEGVTEPDDKFYAVVATTNNPNTWTQLTTPAEIAKDLGAGNPASWTQKAVQLSAASGINLEDYKNQNLYLYFYNNTNIINPASCANAGDTCDTRFEFDDMSLQVCTTQPRPASISTRIKGKLTLHFNNGTSQALPLVRVWAYTPNNQQVYETFTIQGGEFNFYNLPPAQYTIFAQYNLVQGNQIETLAADTSIILASTHTDSNPAQTFLNLYTLAPPP